MRKSVALPGELPDEGVARLVQAGDHAAFEVLLSRYLRPVHSIAASLLDDPADVEDAAQETFLRALGSIGSYRSTLPFAPWLYQVARNVARDRRAANTRRRTEPLTDHVLPESSDGADIQLERAEIRGLVADAMQRLPEQQRAAFQMHDVDGYTTAEVARIMGLTTGTIRSHIHYARSTLRCALSGVLHRHAAEE